MRADSYRRCIRGVGLGLGVALTGWPVPGAGVGEVLVDGDRVNLRARPGTNYEVVGQVNHDDSLVAKSTTEEWVEVVPPPGTELWVHQGYVVENRVSTRILNVRCGPGINYSKVGTLSRNDEVTPTGSFGEWVKIEAPPTCSLWISRSLVRGPGTDPGPPAHHVSTANPSGSASASAADAVIWLPEEDRMDPPAGLVPLSGQGKASSYRGVLRRTPLLNRKAARFRLVATGESPAPSACYIRGNEKQLLGLLGRSMTIEGKEYWIQDVNHPILVPEKIVLPPAGE